MSDAGLDTKRIPIDCGKADMASRPAHPALTMHQAWIRTIATLIVLIFGLGLLALGATQYQRLRFEHTTSGLRSKTIALASLNQALVEVDGPAAAGLLYGTPTELPANRAAYDAIRGRVQSAFLVAERATTAPLERAALDNAQSSWRALDRTILTAPTIYPHQTILEAVGANKDPFEPLVWNRLDAIEADVTNIAQLSAVQLDGRTAAAGRLESLITPIVIGALAFALLLSWLAARRMSRLVLTPIVKLRRAAMAMGDSTLQPDIDLPGATAELQAFAVTINATAASLRSSHCQLREQANTDTLTGLPNRKAFSEHLQAMLDKAGERRVGVMFIDLDDFKIVNDSLGHAAGDELLRVVAARLRAATRGCDMVARLGGDEFAVALDCEDQIGSAAAVAVAERTLAAFQERVVIEATNLVVSASIGIAISEIEPGADAADSLLRNADFSMYVAKGHGKNRLEVFAPSMHAEMVGRFELKQELRQATRLGQFVLHYQPVIDVESGVLVGFEALIRWQHPSRGLLAPIEFIPLAEDTGDIVEIGRWVIDQACRDLAERRRQRDGSPDLWMSVNVSADQLLEPAFADVVMSALRRHDVPPGCLILELTESVAITNTATSSATLAGLRQYGVHVALDDFGMGFSSLRYLHELPIDVIKIDRSFVSTQDGETHAMLEAIVRMGHSLGLTVIAEGIEAPCELERLRKLGQIAGQGYHIARPMPASDAANFLRHNVRPIAAGAFKPGPLVPAA